jgi:putative salt-induced outer membrane protein
MKLFFILTICLFFNMIASTHAHAQTPPSQWTDESELGAVMVSGNTESESYSAKQTTAFHWGLDSVTAKGHYLETKAGPDVTAKNWDLGVRYDKGLDELWSIFLAHKAEADTFAGYIQRDTSDLGAKYTIRKTDNLNWIAEAGYSYIKTYNTERINKYDPSSRLYTEIEHGMKKDITVKYWVEWLKSFAHSRVYFVNTELSLNVMLSKEFSLKTGYLLKYQNDLVPPTTKYVDTTFTTSLVAKF